MAASYLFHNAKELLERCHEHHMPIWEVMLNYELQMSTRSKEEVCKMLEDRLQVIFDGIDAAIAKPEMSPSGMAGKSAPILAAGVRDFKELEASLLLNEAAIRAMLGAVATGENNARMGVILAFPTAGAAGVLPGVIYGAKFKLGLTQQQMVEMMLTASAIGIIIANTATLSGAAGGCQAEVGSATAMAAAALTEVRGKSPECSLHAASLALKNMIGLACDPIGGLVEVPCIKRNGIGAVFAMSASDMAYLGVESFVPFDEVVRAMREVGDLMSPKIRETALGGLAVTPTGQEVAKRMGLLRIGDNQCSK
ncbi:L-serine ammonia-lyase, iron-sulfur-dependent, subunit alpha [Candidatus Peregrinibacteria bacterium]|nr:MAG: L-serine ammonia-lyase, iron-sulfur-dependent, subunit alpha [Candidatus Peregrinibacteria bacterium]